MIPEAVYGMLACARLGAIHSVVFGGFAAAELAKRIDDSKAKVVLTASCGIEPKGVIPYKRISFVVHVLTGSLGGRGD
jgi:propionyl-CoA synthetase